MLGTSAAIFLQLDIKCDFLELKFHLETLFLQIIFKKHFFFGRIHVAARWPHQFSWELLWKYCTVTRQIFSLNKKFTKYQIAKLHGDKIHPKFRISKIPPKLDWYYKDYRISHSSFPIPQMLQFRRPIRGSSASDWFLPQFYCE